ncbi:MAG: hypothetical protein GWO02_09145, partial [Gammaproteobacteria bacterium]|nr:hypothetical protein [Gammaproteobacteria bacterium]
MTIAFGPQDIQREHDWLGCQLGWRFLYAPERTLREADVALITLNPGGDRYQPPAWSYEGGDAYCSERWGDCEPGAHALQRQVQRLFAIMSVEPTAVLSGVLVPFRSRRWESWPQQA